MGFSSAFERVYGTDYTIFSLVSFAWFILKVGRHDYICHKTIDFLLQLILVLTELLWGAFTLLFAFSLHEIRVPQSVSDVVTEKICQELNFVGFFGSCLLFRFILDLIKLRNWHQVGLHILHLRVQLFGDRFGEWFVSLRQLCARAL